MNFFRDFDWKPLALVPVLALLVLPFIGSPSTWLTLTVAGLAMGMIIFIIASGLTLVFGLMDVLNFGHGVFIALGAFVATSVLGAMGDYTASGSLWVNLMAVLPAMVVAMLVAGAIGLAFERFIVRPVYGNHLKQILITMGGMIIGEELIKVIWGPGQLPLPLPEALRGTVLVGDAAVGKYRLLAVGVGGFRGLRSDPRRVARPRAVPFGAGGRRDLAPDPAARILDRRCRERSLRPRHRADDAPPARHLALPLRS